MKILYLLLSSQFDLDKIVCAIPSVKHGAALQSRIITVMVELQNYPCWSKNMQ